MDLFSNFAARGYGVTDRSVPLSQGAVLPFHGRRNTPLGPPTSPGKLEVDTEPKSTGPAA
jgi:hypothetical protein